MTETVVHRVRDLARAEPDRLLIELWHSSGEGRASHLTYGALWARGARVGAALEMLADRPCVAIVCPLGPELFEAHFGTLLAGGRPALFPASEAPGPRLSSALSGLAPDAVLTTAALLGPISEVYGGQVLDVAALPAEGLHDPRGWEAVGPDDVALLTTSALLEPIAEVNGGQVLDAAVLPPEGLHDPRGWEAVGPEDVALLPAGPGVGARGGAPEGAGHPSGGMRARSGAEDAAPPNEGTGGGPLGARGGAPEGAARRTRRTPAALTHAQVLAACAAYARALRADPELDKVVAGLPPEDPVGLFTSWLLPLLQAIPVAAMEAEAWRRQPALLLRLASDVTATLAWVPGPLLGRLAAETREDQLADVDLSSIRGFSAVTEGEEAAVQRAFLERFAPFGVRPDALWTCCAAEAGVVISTAGPPGIEARSLVVDPERLEAGEVTLASEGRELVSSGPPLEGWSLDVRDARGRLVPPGRVGAIAALGPFTAGAGRGDEAFVCGRGFLWEDQLYVTGGAVAAVLEHPPGDVPPSRKTLAREWASSVALGLLVAVAVYVVLIFEPGWSWGVHGGW